MNFFIGFAIFLYFFTGTLLLSQCRQLEKFKPPAPINIVEKFIFVILDVFVIITWPAYFITNINNYIIK
jgi:hypothetical protein